MIRNLFSSFDPTSNFNLSLNWIRTILGLLLMPNLYWILPNRWTILLNKIFIRLHKEFYTLTKTPSNSLIFLRLFILIIINNFLGLFPYIFTRTRHLVITLRLALPLWLSFIIYGWFINTYHIFAHLVPQGTPPILMPFIVCIETIRNLIRPGTLAVRLRANIIAGHLLLTLLGNTGPMLNFLLRILIITQILLLILEMAVSIIQSYVFAILRTLYSREV